VIDPGIRKAALVLRRLPADAVGLLLARLEPGQAAAVQTQLARIDDSGGTEGQTALEAFAADISAAHSTAEKDNGMAARVRLGSLTRADIARLRATLVQERPQTVALILSLLPTDVSAELLRTLAPDAQSAVARGIGAMREVDRRVVREVETALADILARSPARQTDTDDGAAAVAGILAFLDQDAEQTLFDDVARHEPETVEGIRRRTASQLAPETVLTSSRLVA
jgi:flagellar motor switch protein FliG